MLVLSVTKGGRRSDYFRFKQMGLGQAIPEGVGDWVDLGYQGIETDFPHLDVVIPHKKPRKGELTCDQRQENHLISQIRVRVEHVIGRLKRLGAVSNIYRNHNQYWVDTFIYLAAGLSNYHLRLA